MRSRLHYSKKPENISISQVKPPSNQAVTCFKEILLQTDDPETVIDETGYALKRAQQ